jgi:hypothetical protein
LASLVIFCSPQHAAFPPLRSTADEESTTSLPARGADKACGESAEVVGQRRRFMEFEFAAQHG